MRTAPHKYADELRVTVQGVKLCVRDVYIRGTEKSLTMSGSTGQVRWTMCQLGWYLAERTVSGNLHVVINHFLR